MDLQLKGKNVVITGSADGFGKELAIRFAEEGANVVLHARKSARNLEKIENLKQYLQNTYHIQVYVVYADLSNEKEVLSFFEQTALLCDPDVIVNNAAIWPTDYVQNMSHESFKETIDINLFAPFILSRDFANYFIDKRKKGKIINMVSQAAFHGSTSGHAHYAASKAGLVGFSISLAREIAKHGICVNCIAPGMMRTPMNRAALEEREQEYLKRIPLNRIADPQEVAYAVLFLSSNKADYITGATLDVTGGMLMR